MGEARRRGTRDERIAQAVERRERDAAERREARAVATAAEAERIRNLPLEIRKEVLLRQASPKHRVLMLAAAAALAMPPMERK